MPSSSAMVPRGEELDSREEATDGEAEEEEEGVGEGEVSGVAKDEEADCKWPAASLVVLLLVRFCSLDF